MRRAVRWVSEMRGEQPERSLGSLIGDAALRFDLSPNDTRLLENFFLRNG